MIEPVGGAVNHLGLAGVCIDREEGARQAGRERGFHHLTLVQGLNELLRRLRAICVVVGAAIGFNVGSGEQGFIGVNSGDRRRVPLGHLRDFARSACIGIGREDRAILDVVDVWCLSAGDDDAHASGDDGLGGVRLEIERGDAVGRGVDHLPAVGGVTVLVEIEAGAAGLVGEADYAMACIGIDPGARRFGGGLSEGFEGGDENCGKGEAVHG